MNDNGFMSTAASLPPDGTGLADDRAGGGSVSAWIPQS